MTREVDSLSGSKIPNKTNSSYIGIIKLKDKPARHLDLHVINYDNIPFHLLYFASGEQFSRQLRQRAKNMGYRLNNKGLFKKGSKKRVQNVKTEKNVFKELGINWIPPEKRLKALCV